MNNAKFECKVIFKANQSELRYTSLYVNFQTVDSSSWTKILSVGQLNSGFELWHDGDKFWMDVTPTEKSRDELPIINTVHGKMLDSTSRLYSTAFNIQNPKKNYRSLKDVHERFLRTVEILIALTQTHELNDKTQYSVRRSNFKQSIKLNDRVSSTKKFLNSKHIIEDVEDLYSDGNKFFVSITEPVISLDPIESFHFTNTSCSYLIPQSGHKSLLSLEMLHANHIFQSVFIEDEKDRAAMLHLLTSYIKSPEYQSLKATMQHRTPAKDAAIPVLRKLEALTNEVVSLSDPKKVTDDKLFFLADVLELCGCIHSRAINEMEESALFDNIQRVINSVPSAYLRLFYEEIDALTRLIVKRNTLLDGGVNK